MNRFFSYLHTFLTKMQSRQDLEAQSRASSPGSIAQSEIGPLIDNNPRSSGESVSEEPSTGRPSKDIWKKTFYNNHWLCFIVCAVPILASYFCEGVLITSSKELLYGWELANIVFKVVSELLRLALFVWAVSKKDGSK
ncbi:hypothetical protein GLAREA_07474 [Glarea lozoyensis ATCC 20868]|uniref:Uncharacterized protein n=1 Tax=Glarea lozoyensis (strain ATCC 20868 / MF5171) TaxID=1116229 RepID=S3DJX3_GLAL2|nr:uncharacterized protein GLAREA_07474 [Glarea lozoyensis ATCC 20868]EPE32341.1 hypothetical protein GLAREA_07474 [Glarea lozoyensis ATCC 20868]